MLCKNYTSRVIYVLKFVPDFIFFHMVMPLSTHHLSFIYQITANKFTLFLQSLYTVCYDAEGDFETSKFQRKFRDNLIQT